MHTASYEEQMTAGEASSQGGQARRTQREVSVSIRTILLIAGVVAVAWALASIASVLLVIFVSFFSVAVLSPVVSAMERRLRWSRRLSSAVLLLAIVIVFGVVVWCDTGDRPAQCAFQRRPAADRRRGQHAISAACQRGSDSLDTLAQPVRESRAEWQGVGRRRRTGSRRSAW